MWWQLDGFGFCGHVFAKREQNSRKLVVGGDWDDLDGLRALDLRR